MKLSLILIKIICNVKYTHDFVIVFTEKGIIHLQSIPCIVPTSLNFNSIKITSGQLFVTFRLIITKSPHLGRGRALHFNDGAPSLLRYTTFSLARFIYSKEPFPNHYHLQKQSCLFPEIQAYMSAFDSFLLCFPIV